MAAIFDLIAEKLEERTSLEKLEARGTVRLALKESGLDPRGVTAAEMRVVLDRVMPAELRTRGVADPDRICEALSADLRGLGPEAEQPATESPEAIFRRLARD